METEDCCASRIEGKEAMVKVTMVKAKEVVVDFALKLDQFTNDEATRYPSLRGVLISVMMFSCLLAYAIYWILLWKATPPVVTVAIEWSIAFGPYPLEATCAADYCSLYLSGCRSSSAGKCIELVRGDTTPIDFCYSSGSRDGLFAMWLGTTTSTTNYELDPFPQYDREGVLIHSEAERMVMKMPMEGLQAITHVQTLNTAFAEGKKGRHRYEYFLNYLSDSIHAPDHFSDSCFVKMSNPSTTKAQATMSPQFYNRTIAKEDFVMGFVGNVGGAYGILQTGWLYIYLLVDQLHRWQKRRNENGVV